MKKEFRKAFLVASLAHKNQLRRDGQMYLFHPYRVSCKFTDDGDRSISMLHDVIEDTNIGKKILKKVFSEYVYNGVIAMTHEKGVKYFDYIESIPYQYVHIKIADIEDNAQTARKKTKKKYKKALEILYKKYEKIRKVSHYKEV